MKLFELRFGKSKKKMKPIMISSLRKCENYRDARHNVTGFHEIVPAAPNAVEWKQKTATVGGNKWHPVARVGRPTPGWISKYGFNPHT